MFRCFAIAFIVELLHELLRIKPFLSITAFYNIIATVMLFMEVFNAVNKTVQLGAAAPDVSILGR